MSPGTLLWFKCRTIANSSFSNQEPEIQIHDVAKVADIADGRTMSHI